MSLLVISPSGNYYGSEQVLMDWLQMTSLTADLRVPGNSVFYEKLKSKKWRHQIKPFDSSNLSRFYVGIFFQLLFGKYKSVYLNEAGHIRYIALLSRFFPRKKFLVHVRMLEDTETSRWTQGERKNIKVIAISKYIISKLPVDALLIYDGYHFTTRNNTETSSSLNELRMAIIGRITKTKGLSILPSLVKKLNMQDPGGVYKFLLYGEIATDLQGDSLLSELNKNENIRFEGFVENKQKIYASIDGVLHLSFQEGLGRIFLEAIDFGKPLVGFRAGGIGEIGSLLDLNDLLVDAGQTDLVSALSRKLFSLRKNYANCQAEVISKKKKAITMFDPARYTDDLDKQLSA